MLSRVNYKYFRKPTGVGRSWLLKEESDYFAPLIQIWMPPVSTSWRQGKILRVKDPAIMFGYTPVMARDGHRVPEAWAWELRGYKFDNLALSTIFTAFLSQNRWQWVIQIRGNFSWSCFPKRAMEKNKFHEQTLLWSTVCYSSMHPSPPHIFLFLFKINSFRGLERWLRDKSIGCSSSDPEFNSQQTIWWLTTIYIVFWCPFVACKQIYRRNCTHNK